MDGAGTPGGMELPARCRPPTDLVLPVRLDPSGLTGPTRGQARAKRWRALGGGYYVAAEAPEHVEQRIVEAALATPTGVVTGWAALRLAGAGFLDGCDGRGRLLPVPVRVGRGGVRPRPGVELRRGSPDPADRLVLPDGLAPVACASVRVAVRDAVRGLEVDDAVLVLDAVLAAGLATPGELAAWSREPRAPWALGAAVQLARAGTRSPMETRLRLLCRDEALEAVAAGGRRGPLLVNPPLHDDRGERLPTPDLLDDVCGVAFEFDGEGHRDREQHRVDVDRGARSRAAGLEPVTFVGADLRARGRAFARIRDAYARAGAHPRRWVVVPPERW